jgi:predicted MFS family arabinose efflux permease
LPVIGLGLCFLVLANAPTLAVAIAAGGLIGLPGALLLVTIETTIQRGTPNALLGRVGAVFFAGDALAALLGALVGATCGLPALTVSAVVMLLTAVSAWFGRPSTRPRVTPTV